MTEQSPVPLIVLSPAQDPVETVNGLLRRAGHPVYCTWIPSLRDLGDALTQLNPELLLFFGNTAAELKEAAVVRDRIAPAVPIVVVGETVDEQHIAEAIRSGARDLVSLSHPERVQAVLGRELRSFRLERSLESTLRAARDTRRQLDTVLQRSNDAIAQIQEGIVTDANSSWLELFGLADRSLLVGQPIMDIFEDSAHAALKGALAACLQGRWSDHNLKAKGLLADGSSVPVELVLALGELDGEPCVRLIIPARPRDDSRLAEELNDAVRRDSSTGLPNRRALLQWIAARLGTPVPGGVRYCVMVRLDKFAALERELGVTASEDVLVEFARHLREQLGPKDLAGRFGGVSFLLLMERGNERDVTAWCEQFIASLSKHVIRVGDKSLSLTATLGLAAIPAATTDANGPIIEALESSRRGRQRGGSQVVGTPTALAADPDTRVHSYDKVWVKHIKAALMENRFRLVQQPVASLHGDDPGMFDVLVRMLDTQGKEVLPTEFMAAAERNDLLKNIDRWVVGASLSFAAQKKPGCLFVRLSKDTVKDTSFLEWLHNHCRTSQADPKRICYQVSEEVAQVHLEQIRILEQELHKHGFRFALESFGCGRDPQGLLGALNLDFIKVDGALMQGLSSNESLQQRVRSLVETATRGKVGTIAERVEDANTMAVLWQLGIQYIQGYFVNAPESVVIEAR